ncbi:store-operated calcium entry regulator STIMATE-like [Rhineura floridana]|uniref:store-operated calcium entry regulator STIMATE-like n=1 Tax=Rhineura floridana TaxID=261503 RepID=UPI002AC86C07|nr:store-operated calcium entry regulator STIMATE-like [Rhineura floridana]
MALLYPSPAAPQPAGPPTALSRSLLLLPLLSEKLLSPDLTEGKSRPQGCDNGALLDRFGVLVQALLAVVAFSTLMLKRFKEPKGERRPWRIWFYDTSKQAIGALFIHFANVFLSDLTEEDPCSLYLMNFILDATLGMLLIWFGVKVVSWVVEGRKCTHLVFGEYGDPPQATAWIGQCILYLLIMVFEKSTVGLVLLIPGWTKLQEILLDYIPDPQLELVLVMLVVPFIVNAVMFWVVDSLIMKKHKQKESLEISSVMEISRAARDEEHQVLLCPAVDFDHSGSDQDLSQSFSQAGSPARRQVDHQMSV